MEQNCWKSQQHIINGEQVWAKSHLQIMFSLFHLLGGGQQTGMSYLNCRYLICTVLCGRIMNLISALEDSGETGDGETDWHLILSQDLNQRSTIEGRVSPVVCAITSCPLSANIYRILLTDDTIRNLSCTFMWHYCYIDEELKTNTIFLKIITVWLLKSPFYVFFPLKKGKSCTF